MRARLEELKKEFEAGQAELKKVEQQRVYLHETVLRISGAIQVLEELLAEKQSVERNAVGHGEIRRPATQADAQYGRE
jgi:hypothetical protein